VCAKIFLVTFVIFVTFSYANPILDSLCTLIPMMIQSIFLCQDGEQVENPTRLRHRANADGIIEVMTTVRLSDYFKTKTKKKKKKPKQHNQSNNNNSNTSTTIGTNATTSLANNNNNNADNYNNNNTTPTP